MSEWIQSEMDFKTEESASVPVLKEVEYLGLMANLINSGLRGEKVVNQEGRMGRFLAVVNEIASVMVGAKGRVEAWNETRSTFEDMVREMDVVLEHKPVIARTALTSSRFMQLNSKTLSSVKSLEKCGIGKSFIIALERNDQPISTRKMRRDKKIFDKAQSAMSWKGSVVEIFALLHEYGHGLDRGERGARNGTEEAESYFNGFSCSPAMATLSLNLDVLRGEVVADLFAVAAIAVKKPEALEEFAGAIKEMRLSSGVADIGEDSFTWGLSYRTDVGINEILRDLKQGDLTVEDLKGNKLMDSLARYSRNAVGHWARIAGEKLFDEDRISEPEWDYAFAFANDDQEEMARAKNERMAELIEMERKEACDAFASHKPKLV